MLTNNKPQKYFSYFYGDLLTELVMDFLENVKIVVCQHVLMAETHELFWLIFNAIVHHTVPGFAFVKPISG